MQEGVSRTISAVVEQRILTISRIDHRSKIDLSRLTVKKRTAWIDSIVAFVDFVVSRSFLYIVKESSEFRRSIFLLFLNKGRLMIDERDELIRRAVRPHHSSPNKSAFKFAK